MSAVSGLPSDTSGGIGPSCGPSWVRTISFVLLSLLTVCSFGLSPLLKWSTLALLLWNIFRARSDIYAVFNSARRIDRDSRCAMIQRSERDPASIRETAT